MGVKFNPFTGTFDFTGSSSGGSVAWGSITGTLSDQTDLQAALNAKQNTLTLPLSVAQGGTGTSDRTLIDGASVTAFDWQNRDLLSTSGIKLHWNTGVAIDSSLTQSLNWDSRLLYDSDGASSIDWTNRSLIFSDASWNWGTGEIFSPGGGFCIDVYNRILKGGNGFDSVLWDSKQLHADDESNSIDWTNRYLFDPTSTIAIDWNNRQLTDSGGATVSIDWQNRSLIDVGGTTTVGWEAMQLIDAGSGNISIAWGERILDDGSNQPSLNWGNRTWLDESTVVAGSWQDRILQDSSANVSVDWENRQLIASDGSTVSFDWSTGGSVPSPYQTWSDQDIEDDPSWDAAVEPTGITGKWQATRIGNKLFIQYRIEATTAGTSVTGIDLAIPGNEGIGNVVAFTTTGASEVDSVYPGTITTGGTDKPAANGYAYIFKDGGGATGIKIVIPSPGVAAKLAICSLELTVT